MKNALDELEFNWGVKSGIANDKLTQVLAGRETHKNNLDHVQQLLWEIQEMETFAKAMHDDSFLSLEATVHQIVDKRFHFTLKEKFSKEVQIAEKKIKSIDVSLLIEFLRDRYTDLNHKFGMASFSKSKFVSTQQVSSRQGSRTYAITINATNSNRSRQTTRQRNKHTTQSPQMSQQPQVAAPEWHPSSWTVDVANFQSQPCVYCSSSHSVEVCPGFLNLSFAERRNYIYKQRLCFKCMSKEHWAKDCKKDIKFNICEKPHITLLHTDDPAVARQQFRGAQPSNPSEETEVKKHLLEMSGTTASFSPSTLVAKVSVSAVEVKGVDPPGGPLDCPGGPSRSLG